MFVRSEHCNQAAAGSHSRGWRGVVMAAATPIRIVPLHGDALAVPVSTPQLTYRGGSLLPAAQVFVLFWGTAWEGAQAALLQQVNQFFDFVLTSPLLDQLGEYSVAGMTIGHGSPARPGLLP